jgi:predicted porin
MFSKKTAVAAAALLAAFAAQAQSQVSIYGNLDVSFGRFEEPSITTADNDAVTAVESGSLRQSFIGFKGQEDLGGGLKAFFVLESGINVDTGSQDGNFWGRTSVVGLSGDFGTVALGNARNLMFLANDAFNPFRADSALFSTSSYAFTNGPISAVNAALAAGGTGISLSGLGSNWQNSITYTSPNLSGFTVAVQARMSENEDIDDGYAVALNYAAGPLALNATYEDAPISATNGLVTESVDTKSWLLNASYDLGAAKLFAQYGQRDFDGFDDKYKFFQLGTSIPVSTSGAVMLSYAQGKLDDAKLSDISLAYEHSLSKRTSAYVGLNSTKLDDAADETGTSFAVGIRHAF